MMNLLRRRLRREPIAPAPTAAISSRRDLLPADDRVLGLQHQHEWQPMTKRSQLQSAHDSMRWDVAKSRVLSVNACTRCNDFDRASTIECTESDCTSHPICERPYR